MKAWEKWHEVKTLFVNPDRKRMLKVKCPTCDAKATEVQIRAERPPYVWRDKKGHMWSVEGTKGIPYTEQPNG